MNKHRRHIIVFSIGVLMLLARPYLVYQMTGNGAFERNPPRAWSLLQRLVKKKDDHRAENATPGICLSGARAAMRQQWRLSPFPPVFLQSLFKPFSIAAAPALNITPFTRRHRYRLVACMLI